MSFKNKVCPSCYDNGNVGGCGKCGRYEVGEKVIDGIVYCFLTNVDINYKPKNYEGFNEVKVMDYAKDAYNSPLQDCVSIWTKKL
jgi:hypothetical protein